MLCRERNRPSAGERQAEPSKHRQVGMEPHALQAADAQGREAKPALQGGKLALDRATAVVQLAPTLRLSRDERVATVGLDPHALGRALTGRAAVLGRAALEVRTREYPVSVFAGRHAPLVLAELPQSADRDDGAGVAGLARCMDTLRVVRLISRNGHGREAAIEKRVQQRFHELGIVDPGGLYLPGERQTSASAHSGVELKPEVAAGLAMGDGAPMPPTRIAVAWMLSHPARIGRHVAAVNGHVTAHLRMLGAEGCGDAGEAGVHQRLVLAQLAREPIHRPVAGAVAENVCQGGVFVNESSGARPGRKGVQGLHQAGTHERPGTEAPAASPVEGVKLLDERGDFGRVEDFGEVGRDRLACYQTAERPQLRGASFFGVCMPTTDLAARLPELQRQAEALERRAQALRQLIAGVEVLGDDLAAILGEKSANGNGGSHRLPEPAVQEDGPRGREAVKIIAAERKGTLTAAQIKREVKRRGWPSSPKAIETAIHRLVEDGVAVRIRKGVYRFPDLVKQEVRAA